MECDLIQWVRLGHASLTLEAPSHDLARKILYSKAPMLAQWAIKFGYDAININFPEADRPFRVPVSLLRSYTKEIFYMSSFSVPGIYIGEIKVYTPDFLRTLSQLLERKNERLALIRVQDNLQIGVTAGMSTHLGSLDLQPNTRVRREEYWLASDLHEFNQTWKRDLSEDGVIEFSYRALTNSVVSKEDWSKFTTKYKLFRDGNEYYQMAEILAIEPISAPLTKRQG